MNTVSLIGRIVRDAELKFTSGGLAVMNFSLAVNARVKKDGEWKDEADFFDVTMFGKYAEATAQYLTKGSQVGVVGKLKQDRWEKDGQKRSKVSVIADDLTLLGGKHDTRQEGGRGAEPLNTQDAPQPDDSDIPF